MSDSSTPGHPIDSEVDDSTNPTTASPWDEGTEPSAEQPPMSDYEAGQEARSHDNVRDMLAQLQAMIDNVAEQAGPVLREVAAKAAELAAVAGERAGPLAYRAAERTQVVGRKLAQRSKEMATELRRQQPATEGDVADATNTGDAEGAAGVESGESATEDAG